jgi:hypothetical protein
MLRRERESFKDQRSQEPVMQAKARILASFQNMLKKCLLPHSLTAAANQFAEKVRIRIKSSL